MTNFATTHLFKNHCRSTAVEAQSFRDANHKRDKKRQLAQRFFGGVPSIKAKTTQRTNTVTISTTSITGLAYLTREYPMSMGGIVEASQATAAFVNSGHEELLSRDEGSG
jgi:hypothetical protein